eukprot:gene4264-14376_t
MDGVEEVHEMLSAVCSHTESPRGEAVEVGCSDPGAGCAGPSRGFARLAREAPGLLPWGAGVRRCNMGTRRGDTGAPPGGVPEWFMCHTPQRERGGGAGMLAPPSDVGTEGQGGQVEIGRGQRNRVPGLPRDACGSRSLGLWGVGAVCVESQDYPSNRTALRTNYHSNKKEQARLGSPASKETSSEFPGALPERTDWKNCMVG